MHFIPSRLDYCRSLFGCSNGSKVGGAWSLYLSPLMLDICCQSDSDVFIAYLTWHIKHTPLHRKTLHESNQSIFMFHLSSFSEKHSVDKHPPARGRKVSKKLILTLHNTASFIRFTFFKSNILTAVLKMFKCDGSYT